MGNLARVGRPKAVNMMFNYFSLINFKFGRDDKISFTVFHSLCLDPFRCYTGAPPLSVKTYGSTEEIKCIQYLPLKPHRS